MKSQAALQLIPVTPVKPVAPVSPCGPVAPVAPVGAKSRTTFHLAPSHFHVVEPDVNVSFTLGVLGKSIGM
ncbi:MAG: hypothetical protein EBU08_08995 [Micrococcales bacterium]|nr:hypothetical protein [Micrococcales bacterium]